MGSKKKFVRLQAVPVVPRRQHLDPRRERTRSVEHSRDNAIVAGMLGLLTALVLVILL